MDNSTGSAYVFEAPGIAAPYGAGCPGSGSNPPSLDLSGCIIALGEVRLTLKNGVGGSVALLFFGVAPASVPMDGGCTLLAAPLLPLVLPVPVAGVGPDGGSFDFEVTIPAVAPFTAALQAFMADPASPHGFANSNGVELTVP